MSAWAILAPLTTAWRVVRRNRRTNYRRYHQWFEGWFPCRQRITGRHQTRRFYQTIVVFSPVAGREKRQAATMSAWHLLRDNTSLSIKYALWVIFSRQLYAKLRQHFPIDGQYFAKSGQLLPVPLK